MKVYSTRYALTVGVQVFDAELVNARMVRANRNGYAMYLHKPDWHETWEGAEARAKEMLAKKLKSLERTRKKLEGMKFERPD